MRIALFRFGGNIHSDPPFCIISEIGGIGREGKIESFRVESFQNFKIHFCHPVEPFHVIIRMIPDDHLEIEGAVFEFREVDFRREFRSHSLVVVEDFMKDFDCPAHFSGGVS